MLILVLGIHGILRCRLSFPPVFGDMARVRGDHM